MLQSRLFLRKKNLEIFSVPSLKLPQESSPKFLFNDLLDFPFSERGVGEKKSKLFVKRGFLYSFRKEYFCLQIDFKKF